MSLGVRRIWHKCPFRPAICNQTSDGEYKGIDVELAEEAFQRLGYQPEFEKVVWEDKEKLLSDRTIDCLWSCYSMNERENKYQ